MNKNQVCNWLIDNGLITDNRPESVSGAMEILFTIKKDTEIVPIHRS